MEDPVIQQYLYPLYCSVLQVYLSLTTLSLHFRFSRFIALLYNRTLYNFLNIILGRLY